MGISLVVPTWNGEAHLRQLFACLGAVAWEKDDQIIVVDGGSADGSVAYMRQVAAATGALLRPVCLKENRGFAGNVNAGLKKVRRGNDVVVLNNDVAFSDPDLFKRLQAEAWRHEKVGVLSPLVLSVDGTIQAHGAGHLPHSYMGKTWCGGEEPRNQYPGLRLAEVVPFVCAFIKAPCLAQVGRLDEEFFAYFEDSDFCLRAAQLGWRTASTSTLSVVHHGPETTARKVAAPGELYKKSLAIFRQKWGFYLDARFSQSVVWVGEWAPTTGYGYWSRHAARALLDAGVLLYYQPARMSTDMDAAAPDLALRDCQPHHGTPAMPQILIEHADRFCRASGRVRFGWTMSDVTPWPSSWLDGLPWVDEVWVPTEVDRLRIRSSGWGGSVEVVPLGVDPGRFHPQATPWAGRPSVGFLFVSCFQWSLRKNPDLLFAAFRDEFSHGEDVGLYIKAVPGKADEILSYETRWWLRTPGPQIWLQVQEIADSDLPGLYTSADCFVLPSSGEGWCLPAMEALACGLPVITTDFGAPGEWGREADGRLLPGVHLLSCEVAPVRGDMPVYRGCNWAVPDYDNLRLLMRQAYEERRWWREEAALGSAVVRERFAWSVSAAVMRARLAARCGA